MELSNSPHFPHFSFTHSFRKVYLTFIDIDFHFFVKESEHLYQFHLLTILSHFIDDNFRVKYSHINYKFIYIVIFIA